MVASIDGTTVIDQRSTGLSSAVDQEVLATLRSLADLVIVGAGTVRAERYGPPKKPGQRIGVVSHRGDIDPRLALFTSGAGFLILPEDAPTGRRWSRSAPASVSSTSPVRSGNWMWSSSRPKAGPA